MKQYFYPVIFHTAEEGGFWVSFPDFPECFTEGETIEEAYQMSIFSKEKEPRRNGSFHTNNFLS